MPRELQYTDVKIIEKINCQTWYKANKIDVSLRIIQMTPNGYKWFGNLNEGHKNACDSPKTVYG